MNRILWSGPSAIWGGATGGLIIGGLVGIFTGNIGLGIRNGVIIGIVLGVMAEILGAISDHISPKSDIDKMIDSTFAEGKYLRKYEQLLGSKVYNALFNKHALGNATFERIDRELSEKDKDDLYLKIDTADFLSTQERFETIIAMIGLFSGSLPKSKEMMARFERIFGKDFVKVVKQKNVSS